MTGRPLHTGKWSSPICLLAAYLLIALTLISAAHAALAAGRDPAPQPEVTMLKQGFRQERTLKGGETHAYSVTLDAGQVLLGVADQRSIDVVVVTRNPGGKEIGRIDSPNGTMGPEPIKLIAKNAGEYRIEITALEATAPPGRYEMRVDEVLSPAE